MYRGTRKAFTCKCTSGQRNVRGLTITYVHYLQKLRVHLIVHLIGLLRYFNSHSHLVWNPVLRSISLKNFGCLYASLMLTISPNQKRRVTFTGKRLKILKTNGLMILLLFQCMSGSLITGEGNKGFVDKHHEDIR